MSILEVEDFINISTIPNESIWINAIDDGNICLDNNWINKFDDICLDNNWINKFDESIKISNNDVF